MFHEKIADADTNSSIKLPDLTTVFRTVGASGTLQSLVFDRV